MSESLLALSRVWRATLGRGEILIAVEREALSDEKREIRDFKMEIPLTKWSLVVKHVRNDRKLLGGVVLEFVNLKDQLAVVLGNDRLYGELQKVVIDASVSLVEMGVVTLQEGEAGVD